MKPSVMLILSLLFSSAGARLISATPQQGQSAAHTEKVKAGVKKLGVGESAHIEVRLHDGTKLKGYVKEVSGESFVILDTKTATTHAVRYEQVDQLKGKGLSTGAKIAIGLGIAFAVLGGLVIYGLTHLD